MNTKEALLKYILRYADNNFILGQRLSEWCGHGPILEEDIALANIGLDKLGLASALYKYAAEVDGKGHDEDHYAFMRHEREFMNQLMVEQPNGDYAVTMVRELFNDVFDYYFLQELQKSKDSILAALATKSLKEVTYQLRHCSEWVIRFGDGTEESHARAQAAVQELWRFTGEYFEMNEVDETMLKEGIGVNLASLKDKYYKHVAEVLSQATLTVPLNEFMQTGSRKGVHTEHLGYILAEAQYMQRTYPGAKW
ncbi:MAG TPA: 1,2-phenylacetyl-CoA epoxidase subunit PaaC [Flavobacteriales bacterium]|nr:1,2-phenylacetyl-CoA epoxidase subunit PaaC [Flavobacteriales bacterium]